MVNFSMVITGIKKDVKEIEEFFTSDSERLATIYGLTYGEVIPADYRKDLYVYEVLGDINDESCAHSLLSSCQDDEYKIEHTSLDELSKDHNLIIELFSYDSDNYIMEHIIVSFGNIDMNMCKFGAIVDPELKDQWNIDHPENPITDDTPFDEISEDEYLVGGFRWDFEDMTSIYRETHLNTLY